MQDKKIYCGPKNSISISGMLFKPGSALTQKARSTISPKCLRQFLNDGTLVIKNPTGAVDISPDTPFKKIKEDPKPRKLDTVKKWNVDPVSVVGLDLQQLNIMVLERDPTMTPFETIEEVVAQLSRDFKG